MESKGECVKIACVNLPSPFLIDDKVFPPLGILYIASALRKEGHEPVWYDFAGRGLNEPDEDIVFITITSPQIEIAKRFVKDYCNGKKTVIGGCGVQSLTEEDKEYFDVVVKGEGENFVEDIIEFIGSGLNEIQVYESPDINKVHFPARGLIDGYKYEIDGRNTTTIITSRGCPFACAFCVDGNNKKLRMASVDRVRKEIDEIYKLGYQSLMFFDDIFTMKKDRLADIALHMLSKDIIYRCFTHVNFVNEDMCQTLQQTGCKEVGIGIESGDDSILKSIGKGFNSQKALNAIKMLKQYGIRTKVFLMLGLPGESLDSIDDTIAWLLKAEPDDFDISLFQPFPDTRIWNEKNKYDIDWSDGVPEFYKGRAGEYKSSVRTPYLTTEQLIQERDKIEEMFKNGKCLSKV
tara:strand:+ start:6477 stop:7694 length:1218 start_codon:yes stop_codon:yes gene_type:complete